MGFVSACLHVEGVQEFLTCIYSTSVKIKLSSFGESINLVWCAMILLLCFFLLDLDKLGFEESKIFNGANSTIACGVGAIVYLNLLKESRSCFHLHPLNSSAPLFLLPHVVLKFHILLETINISWRHSLCMSKSVMWLWSFSHDRSLEKTLEIEFEVVLYLQF